jgi:hypothetical protein
MLKIRMALSHDEPGTKLHRGCGASEAINVQAQMLEALQAAATWASP